jgi:hypothetical protein
MGWALLPNRRGRRNMTDALVAGSILIEEGTHLPDSVSLESGSYSSGWAAVKNTRSTLDKGVKEAGWTFFFMAGEIKSTVFGFDRQKTLGAALKRLITSVKLAKCNSFEITQVTTKSFLRVPYVSITAHRRHLQKGLVFSGQ